MESRWALRSRQLVPTKQYILDHCFLGEPVYSFCVVPPARPASPGSKELCLTSRDFDPCQHVGVAVDANQYLFSTEFVMTFFFLC